MKRLFIVVALFFFSFVYSQINSQDSNRELEIILGGYVILNSELENISLVDNLENGLCVKIIIKDKEYVFLLDTASSVSIINNSYDDIGQTNLKITTKDNFGNDIEKDLFVLDFKIGQNLFKDFAFVKHDLNNIKNDSCLNFDGIIGINVLKKLNWKLIKNEKTLYFSKKQFDYENYYEPSTIKWHNNLIPLVEFNTNSSSFYVAIDTGYFGSIKLSEETYNLNFNNYKKLIKGSGFPFFSINGRIKTDLRKTRIKDLSLENGLNFSNYDIVIDNSKPLIGKKILFNNNLILNFLVSEISFDKKLSLEKIENNDLNFKICKSEQNENEIELCFFWDTDSNKNLKVGDKIIKIDAYNTQSISNIDYCDLLNYIKKRDSISVTFQRGKKQFMNNIILKE